VNARTTIASLSLRRTGITSVIVILTILLLASIWARLVSVAPSGASEMCISATMCGLKIGMSQSEAEATLGHPSDASEAMYGRRLSWQHPPTMVYLKGSNGPIWFIEGGQAEVGALRFSAGMSVRQVVEALGEPPTGVRKHPRPDEMVYVGRGYTFGVRITPKRGFLSHLFGSGDQSIVDFCLADPSYNDYRHTR
jgi:hypothetical protein